MIAKSNDTKKSVSISSQKICTKIHTKKRRKQATQILHHIPSHSSSLHHHNSFSYSCLCLTSENVLRHLRFHVFIFLIYNLQSLCRHSHIESHVWLTIFVVPKNQITMRASSDKSIGMT